MEKCEGSYLFTLNINAKISLRKVKLTFHYKNNFEIAPVSMECFVVQVLKFSIE